MAISSKWQNKLFFRTINILLSDSYTKIVRKGDNCICFIYVILWMGFIVIEIRSKTHTFSMFLLYPNVMQICQKYNVSVRFRPHVCIPIQMYVTVSKIRPDHIKAPECDTNVHGKGALQTSLSLSNKRNWPYQFR